MVTKENEKTPLEGRFFSAMGALCPSWPGGRFVCAFSGGGDSTALLGLLRGFLPPERLLAAHLDHGLRESSGREAILAKAVAQGLGVRCLVERIEVERLARERGKGLEEAARFARYGFLKKALEDWPGDYLVTAHQAEDQAETVIMKLARGAGPGALVGIEAQGGFGTGSKKRGLARPLLGESKQELRAYAQLKGLEFVSDPSNQDERFGRNLVRNTILPILGRLNQSYLTAFGRAAEIATAEEEFWQERLSQLEEKLDHRSDRGWYGLRAAGLGQLSLAERRRLLGRLMRKVKLNKAGGGEGVSFLGVEKALAFLEKPGAGGLDLPGGRRVEIRGLFVYIGPSSRNQS